MELWRTSKFVVLIAKYVCTSLSTTAVAVELDGHAVNELLSVSLCVVFT